MAVICLWTVIDNWLDVLHGQWDSRFLAAVLVLFVLNAMGRWCGAAWRRAAGMNSPGDPQSRTAGLAILTGVFALVFLFTLVPDMLTRKDHPDYASAAIAAGWRAACVASLAFIGVGLARRTIHSAP